MRVLSLFDGMSCGRVALERAGTTPEQYLASEIDRHAAGVSRASWPDIIQLGDVKNWRAWPVKWGEIDLILAGSPCQGFSSAGAQGAFGDPRSALFFTFLDILNYARARNPRVKFLLENVRMARQHRELISLAVGAEPVLINSSLVSAQQRPRLYWCNWPVTPPRDKGVMLPDVLTHAYDSKYLCTPKHNARLLRGVDTAKGFSAIDPDKAVCMTARQYSNWKGTFTMTPRGPRRLTPVECERLQTLPDNYTAAASDAQRYKMLGNGWTVDVIAHLLRQLPDADK